MSSDFRLREQNQNLQLKWERGTLCKAPRKRHTLCHILMFIKHNEQLQIKSCWCLTSTRQMLSMENREWILITRGFQAASLNGKRKLFTMSTIAGAFTGPLQGLYTYKMSSQLLKQFCQWQLFCTVPISVNQMTSAGSTMNTSIWEITKLSVASEIVKLIWFFFFFDYFSAPSLYRVRCILPPVRFHTVLVSAWLKQFRLGCGDLAQRVTGRTHLLPGLGDLLIQVCLEHIWKTTLSQRLSETSGKK